MTFLNIVFIITIIGLAWNIGIVQNRPTKAGNIAVSIGVFGTFLGILIALNNFNFDDTESIKDNLMGLVAGLKFSFVTSVFGMGTSLVLKIFVEYQESDDSHHLEYNLSVLPKIYEVVKDINLLMPSSPHYVPPPTMTEMLTVLQEMKEMQKIAMGVPSVITDTGSEQDLGTAFSLSTWLKEELGESFKSIRKDLADIVETISQHPAQLVNLNTELNKLTQILQGLFDNLKAIEAEQVPTTHLKKVKETLNATVGSAAQMEKLLVTLEALMLSIIEHNKQLDKRKYKRALFKREFV